MRLIWTLLTAIVLLVIGAIVLLLTLPGEKIAHIAADQVKKATGRDLQFEGEVGISWYPILGVTTGPVSFGNADWSDSGPMFRADSAAIGVDIISAISGDIRITAIEAVRPVVILEKAKDGRVNWAFSASDSGDAPAPASGGGAGNSLVLEKVQISDARLSYIDHGGDRLDFSDLDLTLSWLGAGQPADLDLRVRPAGQVVNVTSRISDPEAMLSGGISRLTAVLKTEGGQVSFDGRAGTAPEAEGRVETDLKNPAAFLAALGVSGGTSRDHARLSGDVTLTKAGQVSLRGGKASLGANTINLGLDLFPGAERPRLVAQIVAGALDLKPYLGSGSGPETGSAGWSRTPIDAGALGLVDGEIGLAATAIDMGSLKVGKTRAQVTIDRARAVVSITEMQGYQGNITGTFVANNRNGLSVGGELAVAQVEAKDLLTDLMDMDRLSGRANARLKFLGVGQSVHAIMNSLSGDGEVKFGQGRIAGIDLDKLFRGTPGGGTTIFDSLGATLVIAEGNLLNEDLLLDLPSVLAKGFGRVGLGPQDIDYTFTPQLKKDTGDGLAVPVRMKGPWSAPKIWPDMEAALNQNFAEERKKAEEKAKAKVAERLGVTAEEGETVEDAVKKKVDDEVNKALKKLLGGE
ncbi:AsmA family protein [Shimia biformata]|uniref:AsmA family protein n=1 Tax=Shimia biformata TaxID=1294299 RepID=UPI0019502816|nr:AsmA family protein [Shimia biformata]